MSLMLAMSTCVFHSKGIFPCPKYTTVEGMDRPLEFVPQLLPHFTCVSAVPSPWIPSLIPQCPYLLSAVSLTPHIFHSCLDLTCEWLEMLLGLCVRGGGRLTGESTWDFWPSSRPVFNQQQELGHAQSLEQDFQDCCLVVPLGYLCPSCSCVCAGSV